MPEKHQSNKMDMLALGEMSLNEYLEENSQLDKDATEQKQANGRGPPSRQSSQNRIQQKRRSIDVNQQAKQSELPLIAQVASQQNEPSKLEIAKKRSASRQKSLVRNPAPDQETAVPWLLARWNTFPKSHKTYLDCFCLFSIQSYISET